MVKTEAFGASLTTAAASGAPPAAFGAAAQSLLVPETASSLTAFGPPIYRARPVQGGWGDTRLARWHVGTGWDGVTC